MLTTYSRIRLTTSLFLSACLLFLIAPISAHPEGIQITPFIGYRVGGDFEDSFTGTELSLSEEETYGIVIDKDIRPGYQVEILYDFQPSRLTAGGLTTPGALFDLDVEYFHVGGRQYWDKGRTRTFLVGTLGATHFDPEPSRLESKTRFSIGLGGGVELRATERIGFRFEGRGFATFLNSDGAIFCDSSGGCVVFVSSDLLWQFQASAGVVLNF